MVNDVEHGVKSSNASLKDNHFMINELGIRHVNSFAAQGSKMLHHRAPHRHPRSLALAWLLLARSESDVEGVERLAARGGLLRELPAAGGNCGELACDIHCIRSRRK